MRFSRGCLAERRNSRLKKRRLRLNCLRVAWEPTKSEAMALHSKGLAFEFARVLLVDDDPTSRLTLKTVLEAGGYTVDSAASAAEAVGKMDERPYELVLSDLQMESPEAGLKVLAHARMKEYKPATALVTTYRSKDTEHDSSSVLIESEDVPELLTKVAGLISDRAQKRVNRELRLSGNL
jgi:CheY-like chemotaxis protein